MDIEQTQVVDVPEQSRYELRDGDRRIGLATYQLQGGAVVFLHTEVDQTLQERGARREQELATQFEGTVRQAINDVRASGSYAMIFAAGQNSAMLSADKSLDVTDQVTARMRTLAAARPPAGAAGAARPAGASSGAPVAAPAGAARPRPPQR